MYGMTGGGNLSLTTSEEKDRFFLLGLTLERRFPWEIITAVQGKYESFSNTLCRSYV